MHTTNKIEIDVHRDCEHWPDVKDLIIKALTTGRDHIPDDSPYYKYLQGPTELAVLLTDNESIQVLNKCYRQKDKPTNVLSFAQLDSDEKDEPENGEPLLLGDIIMAWETVLEEADNQNKSLEDHIVHLSVHAFLHLCGYDHENEDDAGRMEELEIKILEALGVKNPYLIP